MNVLWNSLEAATREREDAPFLTDLRSGETISYRLLLTRAAALSAWLADRGVESGDRVAYVTKNDPAFFGLLFACAHCGAALVPINVDGTSRETQEVLEDCEAKVVLCDKASEESWVLLGDELFEYPASEDPVECPPEQDAIFIYTSGTTGRSKGVILSHKSLTAMASTLATVYGYQPGMRFLSMLPNYHINAPVVTGLAVLAGRSHVFVTDPYGFINARLIFPYVEEHKLDVLSLTPSIMASLLKFNPGGTDSDLSSLKLVMVGTAHLPEKPWRQFEETFGVPCYQGYGLTETTTWSTMTPPDERKRYDSAGVAIGCEVRIDEDGGGEILIRGDTVMNGYNKRKSLTKKSFKDGWFRTGDIGRIDEDGQLFITGRIKNIIKRRGILISPEEIDGVLRKFPEVTDACTIGVPDELSGERVISACVIAEDQLDALGVYMRGELSAGKYPDDLLAVSEIPQTSMGKPDLAELRKIASGEKVDEIIGSFDIYQFRRARTPDMPVIRARIQAALLKGTTVDFMGYWGVGSRAEIAKPDRVAIERLAKFIGVINAKAGRDLATMTLVLADMHARCNQVAPDVYEPYFAGIGALAESHGFRTSWLSEVWQEHNIEPDRVAGLMSANAHLEEWENFALRDEFLQQALNRCGDESHVEEFAYRYFLTIYTENEAVEKSFSEYIFTTYNGLDARVSLPQLPMVHIHSLKPGTAAKPWFRD